MRGGKCIGWGGRDVRMGGGGGGWWKMMCFDVWDFDNLYFV